MWVTVLNDVRVGGHGTRCRLSEYPLSLAHWEENVGLGASQSWGTRRMGGHGGGCKLSGDMIDGAYYP